MSIADWLRKHGLEKYVDAFVENDVDLDVLPHLAESHLEKLGVTLGHRVKILKVLASEAGHSVVARPEKQTLPVSPSPTSAAERRQVTIMFCDLVGSTALSTSMDPEKYREILAAYQSAVKMATEPYEGYIARYMGDGLLVYFGYPYAHEEDPERAVRAALDINEAVSALEPGDGVRLQVRIGIATGVVVAGDIVGEGSAEERAVLGDAPNLAARLQGLARPGEILVAESTKSLIEGRFELSSKGMHSFKGIDVPVSVFQATAVRNATRFEAASADNLRRLLGRDEELGMLMRRWEIACAGEGQLVLLGGEPGIGKSRLAEAAKAQVRSSNCSVLTFQCSPYHLNSAFYPIVAHIERAAGFARQDQQEQKLDKLETLFKEAADKQWIIAALLSLPTDRYVTSELTPEKRKAEVNSVLVKHLESLARTSPILVIVEDAHWIDHSTLEFFNALTDELARMRVLMVVTHRPEFESNWAAKGHATQVMLNRLSRRDVRLLVQSVAGEAGLPDDVVQQILERTDGIPLFVEELTKDVLEAAISSVQELPSPGSQIPSTLQDSLVARLDRLGNGKDVAQLGATIGREFPYSLLAAVWGNAEGALQDGLQQLEAANLLHQRGLPPDATYTFKHALIRDAAYGTLLREQRRDLHARVADDLRQHHPGIIQTQPELLAHHLTEAGDLDGALDQWLVAGRIAFSRSAAHEAQAHLEKGLSLLGPQSPNDKHIRQALELCLALGPVYMTTKGAHAQETEEIYARARTLSERSGAKSTQFKVAWGQWHVKQLRGAHAEAIALADECLALSHCLDDHGYALQAHHAAWSTQFFIGGFTDCLAHADRGWHLYDEARFADHRFNYGGHDPGACGRYFAGLSRWFLGRPDEGSRCAAQAVKLARSIEHPFSKVVTLLYTAYLAYLRREPNKTRTLAYEGLGICEELGFPTWLPGLAQLHDWALVAEEENAEALARMAGRVSSEQVAGQLRPANALFLVDACVRMDDTKRGTLAVDRGLSLVDALGHEWILAELYRLRAMLVWRSTSSNQRDVERDLELSLNVARKQHARAIELRSSTALARLRVEHGDRAGAVGVIEPIFRKFDEGLDTLDLREAKALLGEIS